ncbi:MAG TPA: tetratricopeptide repeat protein [Chitinophagales bacterium]|nr:tetratricopeptide repeat protein [Chitinophagales bacterium]
MLGNYAEETTPLFKMLRAEAFRFVIIRYNHYDIVRQLEKDVQAKFPDRPLQIIDAQKADYKTIADAYFLQERGFLFIENFDYLLKEQLDSQGKETPEFALENQRKRGITAGLNLRRDKLAKYPVALFVFIPATTDELYAKIIMEKMPDLWSFRSLILDIAVDSATQKTETSLPLLPYHRSLSLSLSDDNPITQKQFDQEYQDLTNLLAKTPVNEIAYRLTLYPQITRSALKAGYYEEALGFLNEWETQAPQTDKGLIWLEKGDVLTAIGKIDQALPIFEETYRFFETGNNKYQQALTLQRLGTIYGSMCNWEKALQFFEQYHRLMEDLLESEPNNAEFISGLADSYNELGTSHSNLGNVEQALQLFEARTKLLEELYQRKRNSIVFKTKLEESYQWLGDKYSNLGNLEKALRLFERGHQLSKELYQDNSDNIEFKNNLALSYERLGDTHSSLGNWNKAFEYFIKDAELSSELLQNYPDNINYKYRMAVCYAKLGEIALKQDQYLNARHYLELSVALWHQLEQQLPLVTIYKDNLQIVQNKLSLLP